MTIYTSRARYPNYYTANHYIEAAKLLAVLEGFRDIPYWDTNSYRIGFGSDHYSLKQGSQIEIPNRTVKGTVTPFVKITLQQALWNLQVQIAYYERRRVIPYLGSTISEQQQNWNKLSPRAKAVMISIAYQTGNINAPILRASGLIDAIKRGENDAVLANIVRNIKVDRNRRVKEARYLDPTLRVRESTKQNPTLFDEQANARFPGVNFADFSVSSGMELVPAPTPVEAPTITGDTTEKSDIIPSIASLKSFHPKIQYELVRRRLASETTDAHMPFIKLTSLLYVTAQDFGNNDDRIAGYCPTLGVHEKKETIFRNIYELTRSIVGYATVPQASGVTARLPILARSTDIEPDNIPSPGITSFTADTSLAGAGGVRGGFISAKLKILAYSTGQVDTILKYFARPSTNVVIEYGRVSSKQNINDLTTFNWDRPFKEIETELQGIVLRDPEKGAEIKSFINKYVYNNYGNYELLVCYVSNFNIAVTKENYYEIDISLKSTQQFEVPVVQSGVKSDVDCPVPLNKCRASDIAEYFSISYKWKENSFYKLMNKTTTPDDPYYTNWYHHVVPLRDTRTKEQVEKLTGQTFTAGDGTGYLVSWKFFVDVILNDKKYGILSIFPESRQDSIRQTILSPKTTTFNKLPQNSDDKLIPNKVGYHPHLRSINPKVMIVYNSYKQGLPNVRRTWENAVDTLSRAEIPLEPTDIEEKIVEGSTYGVGSFNSALAENTPEKPGSTLLTSGVWIHTDAIISALTSNDFISKGIEKLLVDMNNASGGYWNLQLISSEDSEYPGMHVIDAGLSTYGNQETPTTPLDPVVTNITDQQTNREAVLKIEFGSGDTPRYIYEFNSKNRILTNDDLGSELLGLNIKYDLPLAFASQAIAGVGGLAQKGILTVLNVDEINRLKIFKYNTPDSYSCQQAESQIDSVCPTDPVYLAQWYADLRRKREEAQKRGEVSDRAGVKVDENTLVAVRNYGEFGTSLSLIEINKAEMLSFMNLDSVRRGDTPAAKIHNFNSSALTNLLVDVTIPGISGIRLWQSFFVGKVPTLINDGYLVVTKITNQINPDSGWVTKIQGKFRYNPPTTNT